MHQILLIKSLLGVGVIGGITTAGSYFGTLKTVEQKFSEKNKNTEDGDWQKSFEKIKPPKQGTFKTNYFSSASSKEKLKEICNDTYTKTYEVYWNKKIDSNLESDILSFCYKDQ